MKKVILDNKAWLRAIVKIIQNQKYEEALGLLDYFPETTENKFLRCTALAALGNSWSANNIFKEMALETDLIIQDWANLFAMNGELLIKLSVNAARNRCTTLSFLFIKAAMISQDISERSLIRALCHLLLVDINKDNEYSLELSQLLEKFEYSLIQKVIQDLYREDYFWQNKNTLLILINNSERIKPKLLALFIKELFEYDLDLDSHDVENIRKKLPVESNIRAIIESGLSKQGINATLYESYFDEKGAYGAFHAESCDMTKGTIEPILSQETIQIERHTKIEFPLQCNLEKKVMLLIQLTKDVPAITRVLKKISLEVARDVKQIEFEVHLTAPAFALNECKKTMKMPVDGDSEQISFSLFPTELGRQKIEIEFFYKTSRVGYVIVETYVSDNGETTKPAGIALMEDPIENLDDAMLQESGKRRILWISWDQKQEKLFYDIKSSDAQNSCTCEKTFPQLKKDIEDYLKELNEFINEAIVLGNPNDEMWKSINLNLQGYGKNLFGQLIPNEIANKCKQWENGITVIVSTNENWIPWELLFDGDDFWGKKYCVARYPRLNNNTDTSLKNRTSDSFLRPVENVLNVIGGDIENHYTEKIVQLFDGYLNKNKVKILKACPVSVFNNNLQQKDLIHCTCHGLVNPHMLQLNSNKTRLENLLIDTIQQLSLEDGCFIFMNACSSNVPVLTFGQFGTFGWEFYRKGANIVIGTLGPIPTEYAITFAESVYSKLLHADENVTIGEAITHAKTEATKNRNLFWILYMIYGDPDQKIK